MPLVILFHPVNTSSVKFFSSKTCHMYFKIQAPGIDVNLIKNTRLQLEKNSSTEDRQDKTRYFFFKHVAKQTAFVGTREL